jgi:hypothetical protein
LIGLADAAGIIHSVYPINTRTSLDGATHIHGGSDFPMFARIQERAGLDGTAHIHGLSDFPEISKIQAREILGGIAHIHGISLRPIVRNIHARQSVGNRRIRSGDVSGDLPNNIW